MSDHGRTIDDPRDASTTNKQSPPGCPPRPEALIYGFLHLQQLIKDRRGHWPDRAISPTVPDLI